MPGPGSHMMYSLATGTALGALSRGKFSPHHCFVYSINSFFGPDIGSFFEWLTLTLGFGHSVGSMAMDFIHDPVFYVLILALPLSFFYSSASAFALRHAVLASSPPVPLSRSQCLLLISAGSLSHFFLDHLFEENGNSKTFRWIMSTGWWKGRAPINNEAVVIVGILCICLLGGFVYINRGNHFKDQNQTRRSIQLIIVIASLYCLWCASQIYWRTPRQPAIGEEADLGVIIFLSVYFFLPHSLCIAAMHSDRAFGEELPL